jgi:hypothetical protein
MASAVPGIKRYLFETVLPGLFPAPTLITYGIPGTFEADDIVTVGNARVTNDVPVMGSQRRTEELIELTVLISCYRAGGPGAQLTATEAAYAIYTALRDHFRVTGNETLGGACREARVTSHELSEDDDPDDITNGRLSQIEAVITLKARQ